MQLSHCHSFKPGFTLVLTERFLCKYPSTAHSWWLHWWDNGISQRLRGLPRLGVWECMVYVMNNQGVCERICTWVCAGEKLHDQYLVRVAWARAFTKVGIGIHCQVLYMFKKEVSNNINTQYRSPSHKISGHYMWEPCPVRILQQILHTYAVVYLSG